MTPKQIDLVQSSFEKVKPISDQAAEIFYEKLFQLSPEVRPMFKSDLSEQGRKLMATLAMAVNGLRDLESIVPAVEALAVRHVGYGVRAEHYDVVGEALLITLNVGLGDEFTPDVRDAWASAYGLLSDTMIQAANGAAAAE